MTGTKSFSVPGGTLRNGQLIVPGHRNMAREGSRKAVTVPNFSYGAVRQTKPSHEFLHGAPLNDEVADKLALGHNVPVHAGMKQSYAGHVMKDGSKLAYDTPGIGKDVLEEAGRLGQPVGGYKK